MELKTSIEFLNLSAPDAALLQSTRVEQTSRHNLWDSYCVIQIS